MRASEAPKWGRDRQADGVRSLLEEGLHLIAQQLQNPRLAGEVGWRAFLGIWGLTILPVAFEAAPIRREAAAEPG